MLPLFIALVHLLLLYHTADIAWLASLGTSYLLRNSIEVLLCSECDKILMVHLRSIIDDEVSMILLPIKVLRQEGRITANAPSASILRLAPLHGTSGSYVNWCRTQAASSGVVNI